MRRFPKNKDKIILGEVLTAIESSLTYAVGEIADEMKAIQEKVETVRFLYEFSCVLDRGQFVLGSMPDDIPHRVRRYVATLIDRHEMLCQVNDNLLLLAARARGTDMTIAIVKATGLTMEKDEVLNE